MKVWVNVFLQPYSTTQFRVSLGYLTKKAAIKGIGNKYTYLDTVEIEFSTQNYLTRIQKKLIQPKL